MNRAEIENHQFYDLFQNWSDEPEELEKRAGLLKTFEIHLLEERFKTEIVENYLRREFDSVREEKQELDEQVSSLIWGGYIIVYILFF